MRQRLIRAGYILAFLAVCAGVLLFLQQFTQSDNPFTYPSWLTAAVVSEEGGETAFDPAGPLPELEEGEYYRFSATLPEERARGVTLIFEASGLDLRVFLDGELMWQSFFDPAADTVNQGQAYVPLPAGGGETLSMEFRPLSELAIVPPLPRLTEEASGAADNIAYANLYAFPAGITALALMLMWGLFLLDLSHGKRDWTLLLPILAAALLLLSRLAFAYGVYFLPESVQALLTGQWLWWLAVLALVLYLLLHRDRAFQKMLALCASWSIAALLAAFAVSYLRGGILSQRVLSLISEVSHGIFLDLLYYLTYWLVLVCALLSAWDLVRFLAGTQSELRALNLNNQLVMTNYRSIEEKLRQTAQLRHEFSHQLISLDTMIQARDWEKLEQQVSAWRQTAGKSPTRFTENIVVNAILQDAAGRAEQAGISLHAAAMLLPESLPIPEEDLCTLLMNLLDNALEGAQRTPPGREKQIRFQMRAADGQVFILCENSFDGRVKTDGRGNLQTIKPDPDYHGFGLLQMRSVAKKHGGSLDARWSSQQFTVKIALRLKSI